MGGLVEGEIIPRLLLAHCEVQREVHDIGGQAFDPAAAGGGFEPGETERFSTRPLELEAAELLGEVEVFLARGVSVESIMVDLLAPSARRLGELWEDDECDFVDVTMGLWRLQEVMREIALRSPSLVRFFSAAPTVLFTPMPGDQHSFGALMVEEIFARSGWESEVLFQPERQELLAIVAERSLDLVGLTLSCDCPTGTIAELIAAIRAVSPNAETRVIIGGPLVNSDPGLVALVGADGTASDARSALALAQRLVTTTSFSLGCV
ncbi:MAG: cobalamin B12-binding domain-containing protein [Alphaproteobacteria bacterium]|nr:cobalamin B12-binding domain-containing protein [Alphaproteobacteria bacterium]